MRDMILKTLIRLRHDDEGVTLIEYRFALALALLLGTAALILLGGEIAAALGIAWGMRPD